MKTFKCKLLEVISFQTGDSGYSSELLVPFVNDNLSWEELNINDYNDLCDWIKNQSKYILITLPESSTTIADA